MKNATSGMLCRVALVGTDVSGELSASFIMVTRIGELGTTLAVTSNRHTLQKNQKTPFFTLILVYVYILFTVVLFVALKAMKIKRIMPYL
jgi:hypothetical protein